MKTVQQYSERDRLNELKNKKRLTYGEAVLFIRLYCGISKEQARVKLQEGIDKGVITARVEQ